MFLSSSHGNNQDFCIFRFQTWPLSRIFPVFIHDIRTDPDKVQGLVKCKVQRAQITRNYSCNFIWNKNTDDSKQKHGWQFFFELVSYFAFSSSGCNRHTFCTRFNLWKISNKKVWFFLRGRHFILAVTLPDSLLRKRVKRSKKQRVRF